MAAARPRQSQWRSACIEPEYPATPGSRTTPGTATGPANSCARCAQVRGSSPWREEKAESRGKSEWMEEMEQAGKETAQLGFSGLRRTDKAPDQLPGLERL